MICNNFDYIFNGINNNPVFNQILQFYGKQIVANNIVSGGILISNNVVLQTKFEQIELNITSGEIITFLEMNDNSNVEGNFNSINCSGPILVSHSFGDYINFESKKTVSLGGENAFELSRHFLENHGVASLILNVDEIVAENISGSGIYIENVVDNCNISGTILNVSGGNYGGIAAINCNLDLPFYSSLAHQYFTFSTIITNDCQYIIWQHYSGDGLGGAYDTTVNAQVITGNNISIAGIKQNYSGLDENVLFNLLIQNNVYTLDGGVPLVDTSNCLSFNGVFNIMTCSGNIFGTSILNTGSIITSVNTNNLQIVSQKATTDGGYSGIFLQDALVANITCNQLLINDIEKAGIYIKSDVSNPSVSVCEYNIDGSLLNVVASSNTTAILAEDSGKTLKYNITFPTIFANGLDYILHQNFSDNKQKQPNVLNCNDIIGQNIQLVGIFNQLFGTLFVNGGNATTDIVSGGPFIQLGTVGVPSLCTFQGYFDNVKSSNSIVDTFTGGDDVTFISKYAYSEFDNVINIYAADITKIHNYGGLMQAQAGYAHCIFVGNTSTKIRLSHSTLLSGGECIYETNPNSTTVILEPCIATHDSNLSLPLIPAGFLHVDAQVV